LEEYFLESFFLIQLFLPTNADDAALSPRRTTPLPMNQVAAQNPNHFYINLEGPYVFSSYDGYMK